MTTNYQMPPEGNPKKRIAGVVGAVALSTLATVALATGEVHFGSTNLENFSGNQYILGFNPTTKVQGKSNNGNIYSFGLLLPVNEYADNSSHNGNDFSLGFIAGGTEHGKKSYHKGDSTGIGLLSGTTSHAENSAHEGNSITLGIFQADSLYGKGSVHKGKTSENSITELGVGYGFSSSYSRWDIFDESLQ